VKESQIILIGIILFSLAIGIYFYPQMPEEMALHWNLEGRAGNYAPKFWALSFEPLLSIGLFLLFLVIPKMDPLKENIKKFGKYYDGLVVFLVMFLFYLYLLTIAWHLNVQFNMLHALTPALGVLYYFVGVLCERAERNWFVGIRTPWTMSNEVVWEKTHKIGAKLFKACGVIAFLGLVFEKFALYFIVLPILAVAVYTSIFSYFEYQKQTGV